MVGPLGPGKMSKVYILETFRDSKGINTAKKRRAKPLRLAAHLYTKPTPVEVVSARFYGTIAVARGMCGVRDAMIKI